MPSADTTTVDRDELKPRDLPNEFDLADKIASPVAGDCPYTLFVGAGASYTAGIPTGQLMVWDWMKTLLQNKQRSEQQPTDAQVKAWIESGDYAEWKRSQRNPSESDYSALFSYFRGTPPERQIYIERLCDEKVPSFGYVYLAGLVKARRFNCVLTTNFDDLLNDALFLFYRTKAVVCAFDSAVESVRIASLRPKIIKLHGDFLYDNIKNVGQEVVRLGANMEEKLRFTCKEGGLVVGGYEGGDESVMVPIHNMVRSSDHLKMGLHWCVYAPNDNPIRPPKRVMDLYKTYPGRVTIYAIKGFDQLMEVVFRRCGCELPQTLVKPAETTLYTTFRNSILATGQDPYLTQGMRRDLDAFLAAAAQPNANQDILIDRADAVHKAGNELAAAGRHDEARARFAEGITIVDKVLQEGPTSRRVLARARKRETGLHLGLGEVAARQRHKDGVEANAQNALDAVRRGVGELATVTLAEMSLMERRTFQYNGICAYALLATVRGLTVEEKDVAKQYLRELKSMDPGRDDVNALPAEFGYAELRKQLKLKPDGSEEGGEVGAGQVDGMSVVKGVE